MSVLFESKEEAEEINSTCAFCGLIKFYEEYVDGYYQLIRCPGETCTKHCKWNHTSEHIYVPQGDHEDAMMIIRGG